ncbi:hypothetical protein BMS3Abin04_03075 [bacterium BMS3Abin04]|nr:hypothetical protein BMS3Abin04_03075 [bacterium BMS3Abin04]
MNNRYFNFLIIFFLFVFYNFSSAQTFDGHWSADYVTNDDAANGTGNRTLAVATLEENSFVALVTRSANKTFYIVGYRNADSTHGRLGNYGYGSGVDSFQTRWISGFSQTDLFQSKGIAAKDGIIYVTNNGPDHFILTFELGTDSIVTHDARLSTGDQNIWAIDIDNNGKVYVTREGDSTHAGSILIYNNLTDEPGWTSGNNIGTPLQTIQLPDPGSARGIAVNEDGSVIYVSNYLTKKIYCFTGDPINGYTLYNGFNFNVDTTFTASDSTTFSVGPFGLAYLRGNNLLFVAHDADFHTGTGYEYGRIYIADPNTGSVLDTIDVAGWNILINGSTTNHNTGIASGFASVYSVDFDINKNVYSQSYYGWTVDKWRYSGTLPTVELTITAVEKVANSLPANFSLTQNYPNPFNPTTTIKFTVPEKSELSISVFDITGKLVSKLIDNAEFSAGEYKVTFDASNLASGTYIYRMRTKSQNISKKMILIK